MSALRRRRVLGAALALPLFPLSMPAQAQASKTVDVVKILSFSCNFCYASEGQDPAIEAAVRRTGGRFVKAPVPSLPQDNGAMQRVYYASREQGLEFSQRVLASLYKGSQEAQVSLFDYMQVYTWLLQDIPDDEPKFNELFKKAQGDVGAQALGRAVKLAMDSGVQSLPTYLVLVKGEVLAVLDNNSGESRSGGLRSLVIEKIQSLST